MSIPLYSKSTPRVRSFSPLLTLLPSFIGDLVRPQENRHLRKLHPTSYLDGLRGLAAVAVFIYHFTDYNHKYFLPAWGTEGGTFLQLPYIRIIYCGTPMVHIFFVISGFALSYRPLKLLHSRNVAASNAVLASSIFRRPIRLFGPCLVLTFINVFLCRLDLIHYIQLQPSLSAQISDWGSDVFRRIVWPWAWDSLDRPHYNVHLWTIPIEFTHSMLVFLTLLLLSRLRMLFRSIITVSLMLYSLSCAKWAAFEFLGGVFLADLHILGTNNPSLLRITFSGSRALIVIIQVSILLAVGWIISWPQNDSDTIPSFVYLKEKAPEQFKEKGWQETFWYSISAFFLVWVSGHVFVIRRVLESRVAQYSGRISFAFYIIQHPVLNLVMGHLNGSEGTLNSDGTRTGGSGLKGWIGVDTAAEKIFCWFMGLMIIGSLLVWAADLFTRAIDVQFVKLAKNIEAKVCVAETLKA
jgi:peptidoglycan/LPS O-acetylase OafA/YrhL